MQAYIAVPSEAMAKEVANCFLEGVQDLAQRFDSRNQDADEVLLTIENLTHAARLLLGYARYVPGGGDEA